jgi:ketosteroid isomerase-like protein
VRLANLDVVQQAEDAINRRDPHALTALLAPDCEIVPIRADVDETVFRGPNAAAEWLAAQDDSWTTLRADVESHQRRSVTARLSAHDRGILRRHHRATGRLVSVEKGHFGDKTTIKTVALSV